MVEAGLSRSEDYCFFEDLAMVHLEGVGLAGRTRDYHILVVGAKGVKVDDCHVSKDQQENMGVDHLKVSVEGAAAGSEAFQ